ncbi:MAG: TIGR02757 family protein [Bacteroidales bacterium]|jgi:uncharacterized protein (TIGR02757 family)|nr:TIGR02757 family protein [Bacteroidales bacterium]
MNTIELKKFLDEKYYIYCTPDFIENDPISIPHLFSCKEDIEISGFITATIAWGNRTMIINNATKFMNYLDNSPFDFVLNHSENDLLKLKPLVHRTFNGDDFIFFIKSLKNIYLNYGGLEKIFSKNIQLKDNLINFYKIFFYIEHLSKTQRHIANVEKGSAAKRINMFLRWMVRNDCRGVDFGLWKNISPADLFIPLDVHCGRMARMLELLNRKQNDWKAVVELTENLKKFDENDPVKYDFALFGLGVNNDFDL